MTKLSSGLLFILFLCVTGSVVAQESFYHIKLYAIDDVDIRNPKGSVIHRVSPFVGLLEESDVERNGLSYEPGTDEKEFDERDPLPRIWAPHAIYFCADKADYEIRFRTTSSRMMHFEIQKGKGLNREDADLMIAYRDMKDLRIPAGVNARFRFTASTVSNLELDIDRNGTYETNIRPQFRVTGSVAKDDVWPRVTIKTSITGSIATITLAATDSGSGIKEIRYQIADASTEVPVYTGPFKVDISKDVIVYAFADDFAGNRGLEFVVFANGAEKVGADPYNLRSDPFRVKPKPRASDSPAYPASDPFQLKSKPY